MGVVICTRRMMNLLLLMHGLRLAVSSTKEEETFELVKRALLALPPEKRRVPLKPMEILSNPDHQDRIEHFVVLFMENHSADHYFGCMGLPGFDGLPLEGYKIKGPAGIEVNISCGLSDYVCSKGPTFDKFSSFFKGTKELKAYKYPYTDDQSEDYAWWHGLEPGSNATAVKMFSKEQIPIKTALAQEFGVFNRLFTAVPGPSSPNHLMAQSGTSCGMRDNQLYNDCGGDSATFPQMSIYDSMRLHNISFGFFMNSTCGINGNPPCTGEATDDPDSASAINTPDVAMDGVGRYVDSFYSQEIFYEQAANGTLPAFSWINPPLQACDHPCYDIAKGERFLKDIYEALRASPSWNKTALLVVYDDAGGYYDHVIPPYKDVPDDESPCNIQGRCGDQLPFDFRRLGLRSAAMMISPLVSKGVVFQEPQAGPTNTSQFDLTSIAASVKTLFNLTDFLTKRDAWAGHFDELFTETQPRTDTPLHLPDAPDPSAPWDPPPAENYNKVYEPGHCSAWDGASEEVDCAGLGVVTLKQRRQIKLLSQLTSVPIPDIDTMDTFAADYYIASLWSDWLAIAPTAS